MNPELQNIAVDGSVVGDYKPSIEEYTEANKFGGLRWTSLSDTGHEYQGDEVPEPANKLNIEIDRALEFESEQDLVRSIAYGMGLALKAVGDEKTAAKAGSPEYDPMICSLVDEARRITDGYNSRGINNLSELKEVHESYDGRIKEDMFEAVTSFDDLMDRIE